VQAVSAGFDVTVLEAGRTVADHVRQWGHVRMFTPFRMNHSASGCDVVRAGDGPVQLPEEDAILSGAEFIERYLGPLAASPLLQGRIRTGQRVVAIARHGLLKMESVGDPRKWSPFMLLTETPDDAEQTFEADAVIDASGVYGHPNCFGPGGMPAIGERTARSAIRYGVVDIAGRERDFFVGKRTILIGAGYSAATSALALRSLVEADERASFVWLTRANHPAPIPVVPNDPLPNRRKLTQEANRICGMNHPRMRHIPGAWVDRVDRCGDERLTLSVISGHGRRERIEANVIVANVGFAPDRSLYEHLQVQECFATGAPLKFVDQRTAGSASDGLAPRLPTAEGLVHPEPNFFVIGAKSFGRDPTFLLQDGLAQVPLVTALLTKTLLGRD